MVIPIRLLRIMNLGLFFLLVASQPVHADSPPANRHVLIIHSYHSGLSWTDSIMNGIRDTFARSEYDIQLSAEYLDARRVVDPAGMSKIQTFVISKLKGTAPNLVIVSDNTALDFVLKERARLFPDVPVVFCGINDFGPSTISNYHDITGVAEDVSIIETVNLALRFHPKAGKIVVIGRTTVAADKYNRDSFAAALPGLPSRIQVTFWDDLPVSELKRRMETLGDDTVLFLNGLIQDEAGRQLMYGETTKWISRHSSVPVYSLWDVYLGYGIVGGKLVSAYRQGQLAAELALRILNGESVGRIPAVNASDANHYLFDYQQLTRFDIPVSELPRDSIIVNRPDSFYLKYKHFVWTTAGVVSILVGFVVLLSITIMRRRKAEEGLRQANLVVENSPVVLFRWKAAEGWPVELVSKNVAQFGYDPTELLSGAVPFASIVHPEDLERVATEVQEHSASGVDQFRQEYRIVTKDGNIRWIDDHTVIERNADGKITHFQGITMDITERKQAESEQAKLKEQLFQSQKMETVGLLAGGVAHDFNNLLTPILGYSEMLMRSFPVDDQNRVKLEYIKQAADMARGLTRRLLAFGRKQVLELRVIKLGDVINEFEPVLHRTIHENIQIRINTALSGGIVRVDTGQIEQVLLNLAINAQDAMPAGGVLTIETRDIDLDESYTSTHLEVIPGPYVMLSVSDTGMGMDEQILEHIFEPFFTTKELGRGTGLGLATLYGIVKQHDGSLSVYSEKGSGSAFKIYLPRVVEQGTMTALHSHQADEFKHGAETVLVVEDNEMVRTLACKVLDTTCSWQRMPLTALK